MFNEEKIQKLYSYSLSLTKDRDRAYDLLQTAFVKFYASQGENKEYPSSYIYKIIKNQFIDDCRKNKQWRMESVDDTENPSNVALFSLDSVDDLLISKDETERILELLNPKDREMLYMWAVEGYTIQNLSEMFNMPKGTVLSKFYRLKRRLRKQIEAFREGRAELKTG